MSPGPGGAPAGPAGAPSPSPRPPGPVVARRARDRLKRRRGGGFVIAFLLANAVPAAAAVWFFTRPPEDRQRLLDAIPSGVATRAGTAGLAFVLLLVLALVVLPGARGLLFGLSRALAWVRERRGVARVLLYPAEAVLHLLWIVGQALFALDAIAILACAAAFLLYVARIVKPDALGWLPG